MPVSSSPAGLCLARSEPASASNSGCAHFPMLKMSQECTTGLKWPAGSRVFRFRLWFPDKT